jgi:hypothetical protein
VVPLAPGASVRFDLAIEHFAGAEIAAERARIEGLAGGQPIIHAAPRVGWSAT